MSSRFGTPARGCTRLCPEPSRRWPLRAEAALALLASLGFACSFEPPATSPIPQELLDARPPVSDTGLPDAGPDPDGGPNPDAETQDQGGPDLGLPDALPPSDGGEPTDATPPDAAPPPDSGPDAGFPDATPPDAGPPVDAGCGLALPASPAVVATYTAPHAIDVPVLLFDADGDGEEEIIVASKADRSFSVIDVDACGLARVSTQTNVRMDEDGPAGIFLEQAPAIVTAGNGEVRGYRYDPAASPAISTSNALRVQNLGTLAFFTGDPPGEAFMVSGRASDDDPVFFTFDSSLSRTETDLDAVLSSRSAFLGPFGSGLASFVGASSLGLFALLPGQDEVVLDSGNGLVPESDVSVFRLGTVPVSGRALAVYGAQQSTNTRQLRFVLVNPQSPAGPDRGSASMAQRPRSGPVLATRGRPVLSDELLVYYVREPNHLHGCAVSNLDSQAVPIGCDAFAGVTSGVNLGANNSHPAIEPVTAYVNNDSDPDVIMALRNGNVTLFQHILSQVAAPTLQLRREVAATPAVSLAFYDRLGASGTAVLVPHSDGTVTVIGWATPNNAGSAARLWFQHRRDAARSGSL